MSSQAIQRASVRVKELIARFPGEVVTCDALRSLAADLDEAFTQESLAEEGRGFDVEAVRHFLQLARTGKHPAASGGEQRCFRLASMLRKHLDDACGLDSSAQQGFIELLRAAPYGYDLVMGYLKGMDGRQTR